MDAAPPARIEVFEEWTGAGLVIDCLDSDGSGIGDLWFSLNEQLGDFAEHDGRYGISLPLPDGAEGYRYWAVVKLRDSAAIPEGLDTVTIPTKHFAVWPFIDFPNQMDAAYLDLYNYGLKAAGLIKDPDWVRLDFYPPDWYDEDAGKFNCELFVAILCPAEN